MEINLNEHTASYTLTLKLDSMNCTSYSQRVNFKRRFNKSRTSTLTTKTNNYECIKPLILINEIIFED